MLFAIIACVAFRSIGLIIAAVVNSSQESLILIQPLYMAILRFLQRQGVESKLVIFPNEGHWILKPADSLFWYTPVLDWLDKHLKSGA